MKSLLIYAMLIVATVSYGQQRNQLFESSTPITWLGLDFTMAEFIGDGDKLATDEMIHKFLSDLNELMVAEPDKFRIKDSFVKANVENAVEVTVDHNRKLNAQELKSTDLNDYFRLNSSMVAEIVNTYDFNGRSGIGLMFVVESFSKLHEEGAMWVTFIDMNTKEVLIAEKITGKPGGFGIRNFWAGCIYDALNKIRRKEYFVWRKKYFNS